jgi:UDP-N-acetylmuramoylalanine--D-glutamate ligase
MHGDAPLMPVAAMRLAGRHHQANALAALAMGHRLGLPLAAMRAVLEHFPGLPHRSELVAEAGGVRWINDSKGTNVGATLAAVAGLGPTLDGRLILLAGGVGKGADFPPWPSRWPASAARRSSSVPMPGASRRPSRGTWP